MKWPVETIDVVTQVNPKLAAADRPDLDEIVCFVPMAAVSEETLSIEAQAERPFSEVAKGYTPFKRGDVLVAKITPCFENGKMAHADNLAHELGFGTTEFHVFRPSERITGPYLFNLLRAPYVRKAGAMRMNGAAGQRRVPADFFAALQIPLPPLAEQKRIAGILDAADALRAKRREALAQLDTLLQTTFLDMFGDPVTNPMGWEERRIDSVFKVARGGSPRPIQAYLTESDDGLNWIMIGDASADSRYITSAKKRIKPEGLSKSRMVHEGDFLLTNSMSFGKPYILKTEGCIHDGWLVLSPKDKRMSADFFYSLLSTEALYREFSKKAAGAVVKNLNIKLVSQILVPVPPLELQHRFAAIVQSVEQQKVRQRTHLTELDTLFASLQSLAFRGDL